MTGATTLSVANIFTFDTITNSFDHPGTHIITVTPITPLGSDIIGDALLIFDLIVTPRCDGTYLSVAIDVLTDTPNWTLGTAPGTLAIATWTVTPAACASTITYEVTIPGSLATFIDAANADGDLIVQATNFNTDTVLLADFTITTAPVERNYDTPATLTTISAQLQTVTLTFTSPCELPGVNVVATPLSTQSYTLGEADKVI